MDFSFRPLTKEDFELILEWLNKPHVKKWWRDQKDTLDEIEKKYGGRIEGDDPTDCYIAEIDNTPIGFIQSYPINDYPEHARSIPLDNAVGIDLFIGKEDFTGKGFGTKLLEQFVKKVLRVRYPDARFVVADPEVANVASVRAFQKAGFRKGKIVSGEHGPEQLMIFEL
ncbi:MAG TPA: GNAT family N-acetyltransferase [Candidatus Saccharimonadales bacterium]|nr:GNAT family N-acetyltransferase [Candidatus Saccharimonadales bacterium]